MSIMPRMASALLLTTALSYPSLAWAQETQPAPAPTAGDEVAEPPAVPAAEAQPATPEAQAEEPVEVSVPGGGDVVVRGRRNRNIERSSTQVVNILSTEQIARTGEGNIAGSLGRVTGLSVVGSGYVYVRGLGDRYSLALLNGSPLPSPEPLKRVVPLDIFPTGVIASSLVQKSYSVNYPGEFGGGVINLTTKATPRDPFLTIGAGGSGDTFTTGNLGYTYFGSETDWTGFDDGSRDLPPALADFFASGERLSSGNVDAQAIASQIVTGRNSVVQRNTDIPANWSANITGGKSWDVGFGTLGLIAGAGYSNKWLTRDVRQQSSFSADVSTLESDFRRVVTENRVVVNGLLGLGLEFGDNQLRWTNLYIRDTIKQARLGLGNKQARGVDYLQQDTAWFARQLIDTQVVGEFRPTDALSVDLRASYANSKRKAPFELYYEYVRTNTEADPFGAIFINRLNNGNGGDATVSFSDLNEDLYSGGADLTYRFAPGYSVTLGGAYTNQDRDSSRRDFVFLAPSSFPTGVATLRPDVLLSPGIIDFYDIDFVETNEGNPAFNAGLKVYAGYAKANAQLTDELSLDAGVRYEKADQDVSPIQVFNDPGASTAGTSLNNSYWLPAATLTYQIDPQLQFRLSGSKTIARPQFRELIFQFYFDPDSNRQFQGNPQLVDSQLYNAESRLEWYFATEQRVALAGFYKKIDKPIEAFVANAGNELVTSFANAPEATLYGAELEAQKFFNLDGVSSLLANRRLVLIGNYTYSKSELKVAPEDRTAVIGVTDPLASDYFRDGAPITGQSDHIVNLQLGTEHRDRLSQQTFLVSYASERVVSRGLNGTPAQPDVVEKPGLRLDFVAREGVELFNREVELKFEARNLTGRRHIEYQQSGDNRIDVNTYDVGRSFALSASVKI
ncbi:MAG TPA: TonB-dependent receptor [Sphingomicrobium sp.]|nr:TonB-dependent receptor [Sphingomicrobium sp.]